MSLERLRSRPSKRSRCRWPVPKRRAPEPAGRWAQVGPHLAGDETNSRDRQEGQPIAASPVAVGDSYDQLASARSPDPSARSPLCAGIARVALEQFRRWRPGSGSALVETSPAASAILREYYRVGVGTAVTDAQMQSAAFQSVHPWSAVFVSYVMRTAGAGPAFAYSALQEDHLADRRSPGDGPGKHALEIGEVDPSLVPARRSVVADVDVAENDGVLVRLVEHAHRAARFVPGTLLARRATPADVSQLWSL
jgi:uncharacterized protein DUF2272